MVREARKQNDINDETEVYLTKQNNNIVINVAGKSQTIGEFSVQDLQGIHTAGFGGGGQGYPDSLPGKTHTEKGYSAHLNISSINKGNMQRPGAGRAVPILTN